MGALLTKSWGARRDSSKIDKKQKVIQDLDLLGPTLEDDMSKTVQFQIKENLILQLNKLKKDLYPSLFRYILHIALDIPLDELREEPTNLQSLVNSETDISFLNEIVKVIFVNTDKKDLEAKLKDLKAKLNDISNKAIEDSPLVSNLKNAQANLIEVSRNHIMQPALLNELLRLLGNVSKPKDVHPALLQMEHVISMFERAKTDTGFLLGIKSHFEQHKRSCNAPDLANQNPAAPHFQYAVVC